MTVPDVPVGEAGAPGPSNARASRWRFDAGTAFYLGWKVAGRLPGPIVRYAFDLAGLATWALRGEGVRQLETNLARVRPEASRAQIRSLSRAGMRSYMRYYAEAFTLPRATPAQIDARVRIVESEHMIDYRDEGKSVVVVLSHMGNWDLAGAYSGRHIMPVLTVAERLKPASLFDEFIAFREGLGMTILALGDNGVFTSLLRGARDKGLLVCLLADRDLTAKGLEVDLFGERARVAAGPAALAAATGSPLVPTSIHYEKLDRARRRAAGTPWGIVIDFMPALTAPEGMARKEQTAYLTQAWVSEIASKIEQYPQDWHMLQKVFIADLDPERYARTVGTTSVESARSQSKGQET